MPYKEEGAEVVLVRCNGKCLGLLLVALGVGVLLTLLLPAWVLVWIFGLLIAGIGVLLLL